jgi:superfamily II RNA helicase
LEGDEEMNIHESEYTEVWNGLMTALRIHHRKYQETEDELLKVRGDYANAYLLNSELQKQIETLKAENTALKKIAEPITEKTTEPQTP